MRLAPFVAFVALALPTTACNPLAPPPPGEGLTDGCYYARNVAVLKVQGDTGTVLVPGNVHAVQISRDVSPEQTGVTFTPGFHIIPGPPLRVALLTDLPSSSLMMKPYVDQPTIMAFAEPQGMVELARGPSC